MAYGFCGSIKDLMQETSSRLNMGGLFSENRFKSGGHQLQPLEQSVWDSDARILVKLFSSLGTQAVENTYIITEYDIPGHLGRCDVVIIGKNRNGEMNCLVVELKRWTSLSLSETDDYVIVDGSLHIHPSIQAKRYMDCLSLFHGEYDKYNWHACSLMTIMSNTQAEKIKNKSIPDVPNFTSNQEGYNFLDHISNLFGGVCERSHLESFINADYTQSSKLARHFQLRLPYLTRGMFNAISGKPHDLTPQQEEIISSIINEVDNDRKILILITGAPGCGKTVLGLQAVIHQLIKHENYYTGVIDKRAVFALRNNRLCTVVRSAIDNALNVKVGKSLVQYVKGGGPNVGIYYMVPEILEDCRNFSPPYDLIIVDEAHRLPKDNKNDPRKTSQLEAVLTAGRAVVCLLDESQSLNQDDNGNIQTIREAWLNLFPNDPIIIWDISEQFRVPGKYSLWLKHFLGRKVTEFPKEDYELKIASSPKDIITYLQSKINLEHDCGILASYTLCNGRNGNDIRVPELNIRWLMKKEEYDQWWRNRIIRHKLDRCASVYGSQGFELDYAGLFWGKDLSVGINKLDVIFRLCRPHDVKDDIQLAYGIKLSKLADRALYEKNPALEQEVVNRLINRYNILLSRARKGLIIHCEDKNTESALRLLLENNT